MKVLFLGGQSSSNLADWLREQGEDVIYAEDKITIGDIQSVAPDCVVSYNYRFIIPQAIIDAVNGRIINLHISLLPYNRGAYPNVWSFLDDTPKGVTIHYIDKGIDTGDILVQKVVDIDEELETLKSSYDILHQEIQKLFQEHWERIKQGKVAPQAQNEKGSIHYSNEYKQFKECLTPKGWDTPIKEFKANFERKRRKCEVELLGEGTIPKLS